MSSREVLEESEKSESELEVVEDTGTIEKVKKPHKSKGIKASPQMLANLQKGRDVRKATQMLKIEERAKEVILKKPELVRQVASSMLPPQFQPPDKPKPKKKANKQVIVLQDDTDSSDDDEPQQIIIRRSKKKKDKKPKAPQIIQYESSDSETSSDDDETPPPPPAPPQNRIIFRRNYQTGR